MKCITSPALDDTQIVSYIEGEADGSIVAHINKCPFCSERAGRWALLQNRLKKQLYRFDCPTSMDLGEYHLGLLPAPKVLLVAKHLRDCSLCRHEVAELENFLEDPAQEVSLLGAAKVLIARLINGLAESGMQDKNGFSPAVPVLRGNTKGPLTFKADSVVIILDIQPSDEGKVNILGQVAADSTDDQDQWTGALVEIRLGSHLEFSSTLDDLGSFQAEGLVPGTKELRITSQNKSLTVISNFEVSM